MRLYSSLNEDMNKKILKPLLCRFGFTHLNRQMWTNVAMLYLIFYLKCKNSSKQFWSNIQFIDFYQLALNLCLKLKICNLVDLHLKFLSFRVFRLLSSSLLLYSQRFGWYVLQPSSGVCQTQEPTQNFEPCPLFNPRGIACSDSIKHNQVYVLCIPVLLLACSQDWTSNLQMTVPLEA